MAIREHQNKSLRKSRNERQKCLLQILETWVPNLWEDNQPLINFSTGEKASNDFLENFKTKYDRGTVGMI